MSGSCSRRGSNKRDSLDAGAGNAFENFPDFYWLSESKPGRIFWALQKSPKAIIVSFSRSSNNEKGRIKSKSLNKVYKKN
jgi:hypothetical protein